VSLVTEQTSFESGNELLLTHEDLLIEKLTSMCLKAAVWLGLLMP